MPGIVTNVTAFGAFVDVGVHQDGLVHLSQLADQFVRDAAEVVKVGQKVHVTVMEVDLPRNRIALSMKSKPDLDSRRAAPGDGGSNPAASRRVARAPQRLTTIGSHRRCKTRKKIITPQVTRRYRRSS